MEIDLNHKAVLDKVNTSELDETRKMVYRNLLTKTIDSVNGRTTAQKIQDITEALAVMSQIQISREIDDDKTSNQIDTVCHTMNDIKNEVLGMKSSVKEMGLEISKLKEMDVSTTTKLNTVKSEIEHQLKEEEEKTKTMVDKILDFFKKMPWSFTVLGLGICVSLVFRPELSDILKMLIK